MCNSGFWSGWWAGAKPQHPRPAPGQWGDQSGSGLVGEGPAEPKAAGADLATA